MNKKISLPLFACGLLLAASQASAVTLTFDNLTAGTVLSNQYAAQGATFSANAFSGPGTASSPANWATNSDLTVVASGGADVGSLGLPSLASGNLLRSFSRWLAENGDPSFRISFSGVATDFSAVFVGVNLATDVSLFAFNGATLVGTVSGTLDPSGSGTSQFVLSYAGPVTSVAVRPGSSSDWVGVDNVSYTLATPIPEPGTYALLGLGLALLAFRRRQQI